MMKKLSILMLSAILATACKKENTAHLDGTYTGNFSLIPTTAFPATGVSVQLVIAGNHFNSDNSNINYYSVGDGTVMISNNTLNFSNVGVFNCPASTSGSDPCPGILAGIYSYTVKGDSLLLSKTLSDVTYTYKLKKQ